MNGNGTNGDPPAAGPYLEYQRLRFSTQLPLDYLYHPTHYWLHRQRDGIWRAGLTRFAVRMLGEMVDHGFHVLPAQVVQAGQVIGFIEGFKAVSDLCCLVNGTFRQSNAAMKEQLHLLHRDPHGAAWLYEAEGQPDDLCVDADGYRLILDQAIDRLAGQ